jgi:pimeloyl-ACP methyl ester carboxylesterase
VLVFGRSGYSRLYEVNGVRLYATVSGSGPPLVFLHGGLSYFDRTFAAQKTYFAGFRTVVGIDQRGHGHSPDNALPFSYLEMANDTAALIRKLGLGRVDIVGFSDGGNVGLLLASNYPGLVGRLVISGANTRGSFNRLYPYIRFRLMSDSQFAAGVPLELRQDYGRVSPDGERHWSIMLAKTKALWQTWTVIATADLARIRSPVLVMGGDRDVVSVEHTISIYRALSKGELCILPGTGHETFQERPDYFNSVTRRFLEAPSAC